MSGGLNLRLLPPAVAALVIRSSQVPLYFVLGNHDFYHGEVGEVVDYYRGLARQVEHFHLLHNQTVKLGEYTLAGTPLWTDFALNGPGTVEGARRERNF